MNCRILSLVPAFPARGPGWHTLVDTGPEALRQADALLLPAGSPESPHAHLPLLLWVDAAPPNPALLDAADAIIMADDDEAAMAGVIAGLLPQPLAAVAEAGNLLQSQQISALSQEAARIAQALAALAVATQPGADDAPLSAMLVRRLIRLRDDRARFFPAELFADPAWDMLLDLIAARMEHAQVPVSSLCVAAHVPTTTALRWIRSLSDAGLFIRRTDPSDGRRNYVELSDLAAQGMLAWLRRFHGVFALRP